MFFRFLRTQQRQTTRQLSASCLKIIRNCFRYSRCHVTEREIACVGLWSEYMTDNQQNNNTTTRFQDKLGAWAKPRNNEDSSTVGLPLTNSLSAFEKPSHFLLLNVILRLTFSSQLTPPPSDPPSNAPWFFNRLRRYINSVLTYLLTYLLTGLFNLPDDVKIFIHHNW